MVSWWLESLILLKINFLKDFEFIICNIGGLLAQLVERYIRIVEATGSIPVQSTSDFC